MSGPASPPADLEVRLRKLADEKAYLELVNHLISRLGAAEGLDATIQSLLEGVLESIGGTDAVLYYRLDDGLHRADVSGRRDEVRELDDPDVRRVFESRAPLQIRGDPTDSRMIGAPLPGSWTWIFPLVSGRGVVGVLRAESLHVSMAEIERHLPSYFTYAGAVLDNHLAGHSRLLHVNEELKATNQRLEAALVAADAASRAKSAFLAMMSHELRTPLNGVLGLTEALQEGVYGPILPRQVAPLERVQECGRHLLALIEDVLDLARVEAGKIVLEPSPVLLDELVRRSLSLIGDAAARKGLRVVTQEGHGAAPVLLDERRMTQILANLLSNAVKFTPAGGQIGVATAEREEDGVLSIAVWDTGIGIAAADVPRLFQPFVQLDCRLARQHPGTGLGLSLVRRFAELHGGEVSVESAPGRGSRFTVEVPLRRPAVATPSVASEARAAGG